MIPRKIDLYGAVRIATEMEARVPLEWLDRVAILVTREERMIIDMQAAVMGHEHKLDRPAGRVMAVRGIPLVEITEC